MMGEAVVLTGDDESSVGGAGDWPGRAAGLSSREAEVIALITQGLSNQEIADRAYLSINSVKTYIRTAYRKIGVQKRPHAVLWGLANHFEPDTVRMIDPASGSDLLASTVAAAVPVARDAHMRLSPSATTARTACRTQRTLTRAPGESTTRG